MPVVGHFFVGLATAAAVDPHAKSPRVDRWATWGLIVVTAAYLPDLATQTLSFAGYSAARLLGHSLTFAVAASLVGALILEGVLPFARALVVVLCSIVLHDLLDLLQATDRRPLWPWSGQIIALPVPVIQTTWVAEAALFAIPATAVIIIIGCRRRRSAASTGSSASTTTPRIARLAPAVLVAILVAAIAVQVLRDLREAQLERARDFIERQHRYADALILLDRADHWPSTARPGRTDYLRGAAFAGLGDRERAASSLWRSRTADPTYFWSLADLITLYAESSAPLSVRRQLVRPLVDEMNRQFPAEPARQDVLSRLRGKVLLESN